MIKENELRIGNRLLYHINEDGIEWDICTIDWQDIKWIAEDTEWFNKKHKPIPLTEEWLLKFGFEVINKSFYHYNKKPILDYTKDLNNDWYILINDGEKVYLKYVHQLQNLYFALTG